VGTYLAWLLAVVPAFLGLAAIVVLLSVALAWWRSRRNGWRAAVAATLPDTTLLVALAAIAALTLGQPLDAQPEGVNLLPFRDLLWALDGRVEPAVAVVELVANVLLFVPLGSALAVRHPGASAWWIAAVAGAVSIGVELAQAVMNTGRLADVTDVLANTFGAGLGGALVGVIAPNGRPDERGSPSD
jgi:glycopeptide antibiotics resistance protein